MRFVIYGKHDCSWCERAKELIEEKGFDWSTLYIDVEEQYLNDFKTFFPGKKTVPQIVLEMPLQMKHFIGGYEQLVEYFKNERI